MITITVPPDKIDSVRKAAASNGINLSNDHGITEFQGFKIGYAFDGHDLNITILHKPFKYIWVSEGYIATRLKQELEEL